jgi:GT2 family glycosyltransferase
MDLGSCLEALQQQQGALAVEILAVNSASDPELDLTARCFQNVQLLRPRESLSAGAARNLGATHASARILGFIDADCVPDLNWVQEAVRAVMNGDALVCGPILDARPWHVIASSDNRLQFADFPAGRPAGRVEYCPCTHLAVRREAYEAVGGFSETMQSAEDVVFTSRLAALYPGRARFSPRLIGHHQGRARWVEYLDHQRSFGCARSERQVRGNRTLWWFGRHSVFGFVVILRRYLYIGMRVVQWNVLDLPRFLVQTPILLAGLLAWTQGFYAGMRSHRKGGPCNEAH